MISKGVEIYQGDLQKSLLNQPYGSLLGCDSSSGHEAREERRIPEG